MPATSANVDHISDITLNALCPSQSSQEKALSSESCASSALKLKCSIWKLCGLILIRNSKVHSGEPGSDEARVTMSSLEFSGISFSAPDFFGSGETSSSVPAMWPFNCSSIVGFYVELNQATMEIKLLELTSKIEEYFYFNWHITHYSLILNISVGEAIKIYVNWLPFMDLHNTSQGQPVSLLSSQVSIVELRPLFSFYHKFSDVKLCLPL